MTCICKSILDNRDNQNLDKCVALLSYLRKRILAWQKFTYTDDLKEKIQYIHQHVLFYQEIKETQQFLDWKQTYDDLFAQYKNYCDLVRNDISLAENVHAIKSVVFVWSWPLPITAILLHKLFDFKITAIECEQSAYDISMQVLDKFGLTDKIEIIKCFWSQYSDYWSHDLICLSSFMNYFPEEAIAVESSIIAQTVHTPILARTVSWDKQLIYKQFSPNFLTILKHIHPPKNVLNESLLLSS